jgi:hypothetical protein
MPEKPYRDEYGNLVVPINSLDTSHIDGKVDMFKQHGKRAQQQQLDIARSAAKANLERGGNRGTGG